MFGLAGDEGWAIIDVGGEGVERDVGPRRFGGPLRFDIDAVVARLYSVSGPAGRQVVAIAKMDSRGPKGRHVRLRQTHKFRSSLPGQVPVLRT